MTEEIRCKCGDKTLDTPTTSALTRDGRMHDVVKCSPRNEERTVSSTGGEKGVKPELFSLIPKAPLDLLARVYGFGTKKYAPHNYRKGYEYSKSYDALQRHLTAWWERDEIDEESGLSHLGHAAWHIFALIVFSSDPRYARFDDRYKEPEQEVSDVFELNPDTIVLPPITKDELYGTEEIVESADDLAIDAANCSDDQIRPSDDCVFQRYWSARANVHICMTHGKTLETAHGLKEDSWPTSCKEK